MRKTVVVLLMLVCVQPGYAQRKQAEPVMPPRYEKIINSNWTFNYFPDKKADKGYESPAFDDSKWPAISIPHTWNTYETTGEVNPFIRSAAENDNSYWWNGWGWYRKKFALKPTTSGKKVFIEFEGVREQCKVWINGKYLGDHKGGYASFAFDITEYITPGKENLLAVAVNNSPEYNLGLSPVTPGNFNIYGGICSDVILVIKDKLYIPMRSPATQEGGTTITTPALSEKEGILRIRTWVKNDYPETKKCILNTYLNDAQGKNIQVVRSKAEIRPGQLFKFDQTSKPVLKPQLWSPEDPYFYQVLSEVTTGKRVTDFFRSPLRFSLAHGDYDTIDPDVNYNSIMMREGNRTQEYPWLGDALPKWITEIDFGKMAENITGGSDDDLNYYRTSIDNPIEKETTPATGTKDGENIITGKVMAGEPARIILKSSHQTISADRATVVIITADIVDSDGNHINGAENTIKWSVNGPAALAGHNVYEPYINKHKHTEGVWYFAMPVSNVIRSTGSPGTINVMVSSPGLASVAVTIEAVEVSQDNSIIREPVLTNEGRRRVTRPEMKVHSAEDLKGEVKRTISEINLGKLSEEEYKGEIFNIIWKNNPDTDTTTIEFTTLVSLLAVHLVKNEGVLTAHDYNFNIDHFNNCRMITDYIDPLKLPPLFKNWLRKYYAEEMIIKGNEKDAVDEMNWLNWIPSGGVVAVSQTGKMPEWPKGTVISTRTGLDDLITAVHPAFAKYNPGAKERALIFTAKMNPWVKITETSELKDGKKVINYTCTVEKSKPVLIPFIKFISE